ncbi:hypothetical protein FGL98_03585 [Leekyejoonella antrihumi]|uniref:Uncharacterized protein n=1 Tax=Leekyejoonella antrihumi TaxID=1660198 RepID=A0A563E7T3_9MICO|nr:hypothetical protein FGL98_03585 [Leekyejoonella antrihumi]
MSRRRGDGRSDRGRNPDGRPGERHRPAGGHDRRHLRRQPGAVFQMSWRCDGAHTTLSVLFRQSATWVCARGSAQRSPDWIPRGDGQNYAVL